MNILNWLFNKLHPEVGTNWLSVKYARWYYSRRDKYNREYFKDPHVPIKIFKVAGAGDIAISENPTSMTGQSFGFHFAVSWATNGIGLGGVLGLEEARAMAEHILERYKEQTKTEKEIVEESYKQFNSLITNYKPTQLAP